MALDADPGSGTGILPDTQSLPDRRGLSVNRAGIRGLRLPARVTDVDGATCHTVALFEAGVRVPARRRGTHMSRLVECAHDLARDVRLASLDAELRKVLERLNARGGTLALRFPWFVEKIAPRSQHRSLLDVEAEYRVRVEAWQARPVNEMTVRVPVTTLCPCSKAISRYGAHNQRSTVSVTLRAREPVSVGTLVDLVEAEASSPVFAVLKREDERHVTERAYERPKFAEDLVRDLQGAIVRRLGPVDFTIETENHESIHNHAAYAVIAGSSRTL